MKFDTLQARILFYALLLTFVATNIIAMDQEVETNGENISDCFDENRIVVANTTDSESFVVRIRAGESNNIKVLLPENSKGEKVKEAFVTEEAFRLKPKTLFCINKADITYPLRIRVWPSGFYPAADIDPQSGLSTITCSYNQTFSLNAMLFDESQAEVFNVINIRRVPDLDPEKLGTLKVELNRATATADQYKDYKSLSSAAIDYINLGEYITKTK